MLSNDEKELVMELLQIRSALERGHRSRGTSQRETRVVEGHVARNFDEACTFSEVGYRSKLRFEPAQSMRCIVCGQKFYDKTGSRERVRPLRCPYCLKSHYEDYTVQKLDKEYHDYEG